MNNKLFLPNGYLNFEYIYNIDTPFILIVTGRGCGKTYGALKFVVENKIKFLYSRRTQAQAEQVRNPALTPMKKLNKDMHWNYDFAPMSKYIAGLYHSVKDDKGKFIPQGEPLGYLNALSTMVNMRGFDASDVDVWLFDEFIKEDHERPVKDEAKAVLNAYETINRNRELEGRPPLKFIAMANSNTMNNPLFIYLNLVRKATKMKQEGKEIDINRKRGITLIILDESPISEKKKETALYRLTEGTDFIGMALNNDFVSDEVGNIISRNLKFYTPLVRVGEICIYEPKDRERPIYISPHASGDVDYYPPMKISLQRFQKDFFWLWGEYMRNRIEFEEYVCELLFRNYFD